jgi:hypothetical protein
MALDQEQETSVPSTANNRVTTKVVQAVVAADPVAWAGDMTHLVAQQGVKAELLRVVAVTDDANKYLRFSSIRLSLAPLKIRGTRKQNLSRTLSKRKS